MVTLPTPLAKAWNVFPHLLLYLPQDQSCLYIMIFYKLFLFQKSKYLFWLDFSEHKYTEFTLVPRPSKGTFIRLFNTFLLNI